MKKLNHLKPFNEARGEQFDKIERLVKALEYDGPGVITESPDGKCMWKFEDQELQQLCDEYTAVHFRLKKYLENKGYKYLI